MRNIALLAGIALASTIGSVQAQSPFPDQNNYQCYRVTASEPVINENVKVEDQFGAYGQYVANMVMFCNPVSINGEPIPNKESHLACFRTDPNNDQDLKPRTIVAGNMFGEQKAALERVATVLCVNSKKEVLE